MLVTTLLMIGIAQLNGITSRLERIEERQVEFIDRIATVEATVNAWGARFYGEPEPRQ